MGDKPNLKDFKLLSFDCYGTLIDWDAGRMNALQPLRNRVPGILPPPEEIQGPMYEIEAAIQKADPTMLYSDVLALCHKQLAEKYGIQTTKEEDAAFGSSVKNWEPFPDTANALRFLQNHYKIVILSNVDRASFAATLPKLGIQPDAMLLAEDIGSYKPSTKNFHYMLDHAKRTWDIEPHEVIVTAQSIFHDHEPANKLGLKSAWINRSKEEQGETEVDWYFDDLAGFVEELKKQA
ncbi:HAD-like protein [Atractiella rhizophila]|nr:HAD-like protein [Atractiella rhizophila]